MTDEQAELLRILNARCWKLAGDYADKDMIALRRAWSDLGDAIAKAWHLEDIVRWLQHQIDRVKEATQ